MIWSEVYSYSLLAISSVFFIINPLGAAPVFVALTEDWNAKTRNRAAFQASVTASVTLLAFLFSGGLIFNLFHITLGAFRIAGGLLLLRVGMDMLHGKSSKTRFTPEDQEDLSHKRDIAITPMGIPQLAGPGAIATVMLLPGTSKEMWRYIPVAVAIIFSCLIAYLFLRWSQKFVEVVGPVGTRILTKIMGLMTATMAVQFLVLGLRDLLPTILENVNRFK